MADEIDLTRGIPDRGSAEGERRRRRRESAQRTSSATDTSTDGPTDTETRSRLDRVFDRLAKARDAREDPELAEVIREDADAMAAGFVSLTHNVPFLRMPLIMFLNVLEPVLAFNRVARILFIRAMQRRAERMTEQEQQQAGVEEWQANGGGGQVPVG